MDPRWVPEAAVRAIHAKLLGEFGGLQGLPRAESFRSALARPRQLLACVEARPSLPRLAAAYGFALARGHCSSDGNKRVALAVMDVFLRMNGSALEAAEEETVEVIRELAAGELSEEELATWIGTHAR